MDTKREPNRLAVVIFGDVVRSSANPQRATDWLEQLCVVLDGQYGAQCLAPFGFTQGDELQGVLTPDADPFRAVLHGVLQATDGPDSVPAMRWAASFGEIAPGRGPATHRHGPAFIRSRGSLDDIKRQKDTIACHTGVERIDRLLAGTAPVLGALAQHLTDRQRTIARLALVDGLRQSEIADRLGIARATVSVSYARGDVRNLARLLETVRTLWQEGVAVRMGDTP